MTQNIQEEINEVKEQVIREEIDLGQYSRHEIPVDDFIRKAIIITEKSVQSSFLEMLDDVFNKKIGLGYEYYKDCYDNKVERFINELKSQLTKPNTNGGEDE